MSRVRLVQRQGTSGGTRFADARPPAASLESRIYALLLTGALFVGSLGIGWLAWSVVEWRRGSTASYRLTGLRVVRRADGRPIGFGRSLVRNALCCTLLLIPTVVACLFVSFAFVMGASPPSGLLRQPRAAVWDLLTGTEVVDERRARRAPAPWVLTRIWPEDTSVSMN